LIVDKIRHNAVLFPNKEAVIYGSLSMSYNELLERINQELVLDLTDKVEIINLNPIETLIRLLAINSLGQRAVVLPKDFKQETLPETGDASNVSRDFIGILSSGTTGDPKIIWKTNDNWERAFKHQSEVFGLNKQDRVFVLDALSYSANLNATMHALWLGATVVLGKLSEAKHWNTQLTDQRITSFFLVPSHCRLLTKNGIRNSNLRSVVTAGEKLDVITAKSLMEFFPKAVLTEYYGASELGHISYHQNQDIVRFPHAVGKAFPEVSIQILEEKVKVKSPYVSAEYKKNGTVNDLGYLEGDRLILKGRAGRVFNRRALNIYAQEIENAARKSGIAIQAALVQLNNQRLQLYFTSNSADRDNEKRLIKFLNEHLPASKRPNGVIELKEMPHSEAGKVDFRALSKMSEEKGIAKVSV
jgi:long-chain acyl-CoA synthetase